MDPPIKGILVHYKIKVKLQIMENINLSTEAGSVFNRRTCSFFLIQNMSVPHWVIGIFPTIPFLDLTVQSLGGWLEIITCLVIYWTEWSVESFRVKKSPLVIPAPHRSWFKNAKGPCDKVVMQLVSMTCCEIWPSSFRNIMLISHP